MPACPVSQPPALFALSWPWQEPGDWWPFALIVVFLLGVAFWIYRRAIRSIAQPKQHHVAMAWLMAGAVFWMFATFLPVVVVRRFYGQLDNWMNSQVAHFSVNQCDVGSIFATAGHLRNSAIPLGPLCATLFLLGMVFVGIALGYRNPNAPVHASQ